MLTRYKTSDDGTHTKLADIYTPDEHGIRPEMLDGDALKVARRLERNGFEAYVVGGAVRDLLLGRNPKDFDIATNALPKQVRKLFRNSRIIGRRFRLVHVHFGNKIIEVSTFRSDAPEGQNNVYGALEEDVRRRDFSINALYYSPATGYIIDYVGAFADIQASRMRSLLPLDVTFKEDPVRLIRAVKYAVMTGFTMSRKLRGAIKKEAPELRKSSVSRLTEELFKIFYSGHSAGIIREAYSVGLLDYLLPGITERFKNRADHPSAKDFFNKLEELDEYIGNNPDAHRGKALYYVLSPFFPTVPTELGAQETADYLFGEAKQIFAPLTPPNKEIEGAVKMIMRSGGVTPPGRRGRKRRSSASG